MLDTQSIAIDLTNLELSLIQGPDIRAVFRTIAPLFAPSLASFVSRGCSRVRKRDDGLNRVDRKNVRYGVNGCESPLSNQKLLEIV